MSDDYDIRTAIRTVVEGGDAGDVEGFFPGQTEGFGGLAFGELQRQHAHADQVGPVDPLIGFGDDGFHAEQRGAFGRPVPR